MVILWVMMFLLTSSSAETKYDNNNQHTPNDPTLQDIHQSMKDQKSQDTASFPFLYQEVVFIVIYMSDGVTGKVPYSALVAQIDELNRDFSGQDAVTGGYALATDAKIRFRLGGVRYVENDEFFLFCTLTDTQAYFRPRYMSNVAKNMNAYICHAPTNLGLAWLPYQAYDGVVPSESSFALGITVHYQLLPGNTLFNGQWGQGKICTHEVGHNYGLRHLYDGGCDLPVEYTDQIADTPRQSGNPIGSCESLQGRDSCPTKPGLDDNSNYMGITFDSCRNHFTPGQVVFMQNTILARKPTLVLQLPPDCVAAVNSTDNSPDLQPCLNNTIYSDQTTGQDWCFTDPDNNQVWAWACCPASENNATWGQEPCRQGAPDFTLPQPMVPVPFFPTAPIVDDEISTTNEPTHSPTIRPTTAIPTFSPSPKCEWQIEPGGPANENTKCQLPFRVLDTTFSQPILVTMFKPFGWHSYKALNDTTVWCPVEGVSVYHLSSHTKRSLWGPASCVV